MDAEADQHHLTVLAGSEEPRINENINPKPLHSGWKTLEKNDWKTYFFNVFQSGKKTTGKHFFHTNAIKKKSQKILNS